MGRKKAAEPETLPEPAETDEDLDFIALISQVEPGLISTGTYALYKTAEEGLHISYQPEGDEMHHFPLPGAFIKLAQMMSKGPIGALARVQARRLAG